MTFSPPRSYKRSDIVRADLVVVLAVRSMSPADVLTIGTLFQTSRLFGGEIGTAFMQTFVRMREQVHSNLIGLHVDSLGGQTADRRPRIATRSPRTRPTPRSRGARDEPACVRGREASRRPRVYRRISRGRHRRLCVPFLTALLRRH